MTAQGDLVPLVQRLRRLLSAYDDAAYDLAGSFTNIDRDLEVAAAALRPFLSRSSDRVFTFLETLERSEAYRQQMSRALKRKRK